MVGVQGGRRSEDGPIDLVYNLIETNESDYSVRTEKNVIDSDGTLILHCGKISGGTQLTFKLAKRHHRPCLALDLRKRGQASCSHHARLRLDRP